MLLLALFMVGLLYVMAGSVDRKWVDFLASLIIFVLFAGGLLLLFGGLMRPIQKAFYHTALENNERYRRQLAVWPMSLWMWLDVEGRDRDA